MRLFSAFQELFNLVRVSVYQHRCICCQDLLVFKEEQHICRSCRSQIQPFFFPVCRLCGKSINENGEICGECSINPPPFRKHASYTRYEGVIKELIIYYKFKGIQGLKVLFENLLAELFNSQITGHFDWMVPVPADRGRKRELNPILALCKRLSGNLGIPLMRKNLIKVKKTEPQVLLSQARRLKNLDGAFQLKDPAAVKKKRIVLVDDVYTTGTTIKKCAQLLKKAGADVVAITLARSI